MMGNSPRKKNWGSFVHRGLRYDFLRKKIWTVPLILQFNISDHNERIGVGAGCEENDNEDDDGEVIRSLIG